MKTPTATVNFNTSKPLQKRSPLSKVKVQNIKREHYVELSGALKTSGGTYKFQTSTSKCRAIFLKPLNLYVRPVSGTLMWNILILMWNLDLKPLCGNFYVEPLCEAFIRDLHDKPFCETFIMWNLYVEHREPESFCGTFSGTLEPLLMEPGKL